MKVVFFGYNLFSSCLDLLIRRGHEIMHIYTGENSLHTDKVISFSKQNFIPLSINRPDKLQMDALLAGGAELFLAAEYPWMIPVPHHLKYAVNIHPTFLPDGRGPTPLPSLILDGGESSGITFHKMIDQFDKGDILLQQRIPISDQDTFDTLVARLSIEAPLLLDQLLFDIDSYYRESKQQIGGSYWPKLTSADQRIDWNKSVFEILRQIKAFGSLGVYSEINGRETLITSAKGVVHPHGFEVGTVVSGDQLQLVIACADGIFCIPRNSLLLLE